METGDNMKTILLLLLATNAFADCTTTVGNETVTGTKYFGTDVPSHLRGATIIVRLANGKESVVPAERFKVVPRVQQEIITEITQKVNTECTLNVTSKNRVSALGGHGSRNGVNVAKSSSTAVEIENDRGLVGGLQYQRLLNDVLSVGAQVQTNQTGSILLGVDF